MSRLFHPKAFGNISILVILSLFTVSCNSFSPREKGYALKKRQASVPNSSFDIFGTKNQYHQEVYNFRHDLTSTNSRVTALEGDVRQIKSNPVLSSNYQRSGMNNFTPTKPQNHIVRKGETLTLIARQYGISINTIVQNNRIQNPDVILAGQNLVINAPSELTSSNSYQSTPPLNIAKNGQYKVLEGDTISRIAKSHGVSNQSLIASNETLDPNKIRPGQIINIPGESPAPSKEVEIKEPIEDSNIIQNPDNPNEIIAPNGHGFYQVSSGDTLHSIAISFGTDTDSLRKLNKISESENSLKVGDYILVPVTDESLYES